MPQHENFQSAAHTPFRFGILQEVVQQVQGIPEKRSRRILQPLDDAHS